VVAVPAGFVGDGLRQRTECHPELVFGSPRGEVLTVAFEQGTGAGAGGGWFTALQPRRELDDRRACHGQGGRYLVWLPGAGDGGDLGGNGR